MTGSIRNLIGVRRWSSHLVRRFSRKVDGPAFTVNKVAVRTVRLIASLMIAPRVSRSTVSTQLPIKEIFR
jgi:hypothetical protein